jgi:Tfp pilus assembly protein PilO
MTRTRTWSVATALLVLLVIAAGWFLLVAPKHASADQARTEAAAQESTNAGLQAQIAQLQAQQKDLPKQQAIIADIQQRIPQNPQLPALIRSLSSMAVASNVQVRSLTPLALVATQAAAPTDAVGPNGETLQVVTMAVEVDGTYYNVERFLNKVEQLKRSLLVTGIDMQVGTVAVSSGMSPTLKTTLTLRAFTVSSAVAPGTSPLNSAGTGATGTTKTGTPSSTSTTSSSTTAH